MRDLDLWEDLFAPEAELKAEHLLQQLEEAASASLTERCILWGRLEPVARSGDARLRGAAAALLAGAQGYLAWKTLIGLLHDAERSVRLRALEALGTSAESDPLRWAHALFHPDPEVRRLAIAKPPSCLPPVARLFLLADPANRDAVLPLVPELCAQGAGLALLMQMLAVGHVSAPEAREALITMPWARSPGSLLEQMSFRDTAIPAEADTLAAIDQALAGAAASRTVAPDPLDAVLDLFWDTGEELFEAFAAGCRQTLLGESGHRRLAWSILRVGRKRGGTSPLRIALAALALPPILRDPAFPLAVRQEAARQMPKLGGSLRHADPLADLVSRPVLKTPAGSLDPSVLAGVVSVVTVNPWSLLKSHFGAHALIAAARAEPTAALDLLAIEPDAGLRPLYDRIFTEVVAKPGPRRAEVLGDLAARMPLESLDRLLDVLRTTGADVLGVCEQLILRDAAGRGLPQGRRRRLAEALGALIRERPLQDVLLLLAATPGADESELSLGLLTAALGEIPLAHLPDVFEPIEGGLLLPFLKLVDGPLPMPLERIRAVAAGLVRHPEAAVRAWAEAVVNPPCAPAAPRIEARVKGLGWSERREVVRATDEELPLVLELCHRRLTSGVCAALAKRPDPTAPCVRTVAALLCCADDPAAIAGQVTRFASSEPAFLAELDALMVRRAHPLLPWLGCAWLHLFEKQLFRFADLSCAEKGGLARAVTLADSLAAPVLQVQVWRAVAKLLAVWRWRDRPRLIAEAGRPLGLLAVEALPRHQSAAARILVAMHQGGVDKAIMAELETLAAPALGALDEGALRALSAWFDTSWVRGAEAGPAPAPGPPDAEALAALARERDPAALARHLAHPNRGVVLRVLEQIGALPDGGRAVVLLALGHEPPPLCTRLLAERVASWPDGPELASIARLVRDEERAPELRFALGCALLARGDGSVWPEVAAAICAPAPGPRSGWFQPADWGRLRDGGITEDEIAKGVAACPHLYAYRRAVEHLLRADRLPSRLLALRRFLRAGTRRLPALRVEAARALAKAGDRTGFPVLLRRVLVASSERKAPSDPIPLLVGVEPALVAATVRAALFAGHRLMPEEAVLHELQREGVDRGARDQAWLDLLRDTTRAKTHDAIFARMRPRASRARKLRQLAGTFAWGMHAGRRLTGRLFRIRMIGGSDLGHTRLLSSAIYVSPLPLLRGVRGGDAIVRGLIVHELGHHMYHASKEAIAIWDQATKVRMHGLLNLVADEHLERNLRARSQEAGDNLKTLASFAFQHKAKEVRVDALLRVLGPHAFASLHATALLAARDAGSVRVQIGTVLRALEAAGSSFGRFFRALRMGLGNRHGDPKVERALALFRGRAFRDSSMEQLWEITQRLYAIFTSDIELLKVFGTHQVMGGEGEGQSAAGEGITDDEVQREVDELLDPQRRHRDDRAPDTLPMNLGACESFNRINTVEPVNGNPEAHRRNVAQVGRAAKRLRRYLERLGLKLEPQSGRTRGRALDRARLQAAILRGDPRMLLARELRPSTDLFLGVVIDCSGSMDMHDNIQQARLFGTLIAEAARGLRGVDARFFGFTDRVIYDAGTAVRCEVSGLEAGGGNNDAAALWHAWQHARASRRRARLLVMISDGAPTECTTGALTALVQDIGRKGTCCAQIAVRSLSTICFPHYVEVIDGDVDAAVRKFGEVITRLVGRVMRVS